MSTVSPRQVVIVEDDAMTREVLAATLRKAQYEVVGTATNAKDALAVCQAKRPGVVLLDIGLDDSDGLTVLEILRTLLPGTPVIVVSGEVFAERVERAQQLGAAGFVAKPFTPQRLIRALARVEARSIA